MAKTQLEDMGERLKTARINRKLTKNEVYWRTQIQPDTLGLYETAQTEPDLLSLAELSDAYRVSLDWLITGFEFHSKSRLMQAEREMKRLQRIVREQSRIIGTIRETVNGGIPGNESTIRKREPGLGAKKAFAGDQRV